MSEIGKSHSTNYHLLIPPRAITNEFKFVYIKIAQKILKQSAQILSYRSSMCACSYERTTVRLFQHALSPTGRCSASSCCDERLPTQPVFTSVCSERYSGVWLRAAVIRTKHRVCMAGQCQVF